MKLELFGVSYLPVLAAATLAWCLPLAACTKAINVDNSNKDPGAGGDSSTATGPAKESGNPDDVADSVVAVSGTITDIDTGKPIKGALVNTLVGQVLTNAQGQYLFDVSDFPDLASGTTLRITASAVHYQQDYISILVSKGHTRNVDLALALAADTHRFLLMPPTLLAFEDADFGDGNTATKQVSIQIDSMGDETGQYSFNIPTAATWLTVGSGQETGEASTTSTYVDFLVDKTDLKSGVTQTTVDVLVGASKKSLAVKVTLP